MSYIDISLPIQEGLLVWPGDPSVKMVWVSNIEAGAHANITSLSMSAHAGTHVDAPFHFINDGKTVDKLMLNTLIGKVRVVEIPKNIDVITETCLETVELGNIKRVIFKTRNSSLWANQKDKFNEDYVAIDASAASWLIERGVELIGIDYLSIAPFEATFDTHHILLSAGVVVIEGLDLSKVEPGDYRLICLPLNLIGRDGAPARAILETIES
ncbi:MAG: cyclase family protein [Chloroflexota bacterium]